MRSSQKPATKGSQRWIQYLINDAPHVLNKKINDHFSGCKNIEWLSPRKEDDYAEYRDNDFFKKLSIRPIPKWSCFWPRNGPQWDAFGRCKDGTIILIEAKSHVGELTSNNRAKSDLSISMINEAFNQTKKYYNVSSEKNWNSEYYQYANRIAAHYFLNEKLKKSAKLVFLYFANDKTIDSPLSPEGWGKVIQSVNNQLGLSSSMPKIAYIVMDVASI